LVYDTPETHPTIAKSEVIFIRKNIPPPDKPKLECLMFVKSAAVHAILVAHCCHNFGFYLFNGWLAIFFDSLGLSTNEIGLATLPYLFGFICSNCSGWLADFLLKKTKLPLVYIRKINQSIAFIAPAIFFWLVKNQTSIPLVVTYLCIGFGLNAFSQSAFWVNHIDIAPKYAGQLLGITNTAASFSGILGNTITGIIVSKTGKYDMVFVSMVAVYLFGWVFFTIFAKAHVLFT